MNTIIKRGYLGALLSWILIPGEWSRKQRVPWVSLFNGANLNGFKMVGSKGVAFVKDSIIFCHMTANTPKHTFLKTKRQYSDFILEMDVNTDPGYNAGILLRCTDKPPQGDTKKISLYGYQIKIDPSERRWTGGVFDDFGNSWHWLHNLEHDERARKAYNIGEWNHIRVEAIGPSIKVWVNETPTTNMINTKYTKGNIAIKIHSLNNRPHMEKIYGRFRNIQIITNNLSRYVRPMEIPAKETL